VSNSNVRNTNVINNLPRNRIVNNDNNTNNNNNNNNNNNLYNVSKSRPSLTNKSSNTNTLNPKNNVLTIKIQVSNHDEYIQMNRLYDDYKKALEKYKNKIEEFNSFIKKLVEKLNFKNELIKLIKNKLFIRSPTRSLIDNIKKIADLSIEYYNITLDLNEKIKNSNTNFKFDEKNPKSSFKKGIDIYNNFIKLLNDNLYELKKIYNKLSDIQKEIIMDDCYPLSKEHQEKILSRMKNILFKNVKKSHEIVQENNCIICLADFKENDMVKLFSCGKHIYHENCIKLWINQNPKCPLCKYSLKNDLFKYNLY